MAVKAVQYVEELTMRHLESGGIVIWDGKVLLRRSKNNVWLFPKGHVEQGENLQQAAEREIEEETGVLAKAADYLGRINYTLQEDFYEVHFFLMRYIRNTDAWPLHHNVDAFLFPPEKALDILAFASYKDQLRLALEKLQK